MIIYWVALLRKKLEPIGSQYLLSIYEDAYGVSIVFPIFCEWGICYNLELKNEENVKAVYIKFYIKTTDSKGFHFTYINKFYYSFNKFTWYILKYFLKRC